MELTLNTVNFLFTLNEITLEGRFGNTKDLSYWERGDIVDGGSACVHVNTSAEEVK